MSKKIANPVSLKSVEVNDTFWSTYQKLVNEVVIPYQRDILDDKIPNIEKSHAIENFRIAAKEQDGEFYGMVFQDSDVAKWIEACAYSLSNTPNKELEEKVDGIIELIEKSQQPDGYLNTYFTVKEPEHRWKNLQECHELYCAGHMIEASVAYYEATGKDKLLNVMKKMANHIDTRFGYNKTRGIPGHQEIEIGLMRLYKLTNEEKYIKLAQYFLDERGTQPDFFVEECSKRDWKLFGLDPQNKSYLQNHLPVREQTSAEGHSVRAMYMYTAMAALAGETGEESLFHACKNLWENTVEKRMYITGGIGSNMDGEAFTIDYDLPNDSMYTETCASIGLVFFAREMLNIQPSNKYADIMEKALYNGILSGMSLDGKNFFYVNPLEVNPGISGVINGFKHVIPQRPGWYKCACCPPNVARLIPSIGQYAWSENSDTIYSHLFLGGKVHFNLGANISVQTNYPYSGDVIYKISANEKKTFTLAVRIPAWSENFSLCINGQPTEFECNDGYAYINNEWEDDTITIKFDMPLKRVYCNTSVRSNAGLVAITRGPIVYSFEEVDNGKCLSALRIPRNSEIKTFNEPNLLGGITMLEIEAVKMSSSESLYSETPPTQIKTTIKAVPYYTWGNRGAGEMRVWMTEII